MQRLLVVVAATVSIAGITACEGGVIPRQEIVLPEGDAARGQEAFIALECTACHTIRDMELPAPEDPSHRLARNPFKQPITKDGQSVMPIYNDVMTVTQLVDIVTFLESKYERIERPGYQYRSYSD